MEHDVDLDRKMYVAMREILNTPDKWTKFHTAKNEKGGDVSADSPDAVCFCIFGAYLKAYDNIGMTEMEQSHGFSEACYFVHGLIALHDRVGSNLIKFNDLPTTEYENVIAALDDAIALTEA